MPRRASVVGIAFLLSLSCSSSNEHHGFLPMPPTGSSASGGGHAGETIPEGGTSTASAAAGSGAGGMNTPGGAAGTSADAGPNDLGSVWKSSGCGKALPDNQVPTVPGSRIGYTEYHVQQAGETLGEAQPDKAVDRQFFVRVPVDYDPTRAYRVVYVYQNCSASTDEGDTATYPLFSEAQGGDEEAVYVAVSLPPNQPNNNCFDNRAGTLSQEWEAFQLFHEVVESTYCVDNNRIFVGGYGSGAWVANMFACYFGGIPSPPRKFLSTYAVRGTAATQGGLIPDNMPTCNGPVAALYVYDDGEFGNPVPGYLVALENTLEQDGCVGSPTVPWPARPDLCVQYSACPKDHPVVHCTTHGQAQGDQAGYAVPTFTQFFEMMAPR